MKETIIGLTSKPAIMEKFWRTPWNILRTPWGYANNRLGNNDLVKPDPCFSLGQTENPLTIGRSKETRDSTATIFFLIVQYLLYSIISYDHHHQSILPKGWSFTANSGTKATVLLKGRSSTANSGTQAAVLLGIERCGIFPLLSARHSLSSIWTQLKRSENIPWVPRGGEESGFGKLAHHI